MRCKYAVCAARSVDRSDISDLSNQIHRHQYLNDSSAFSGSTLRCEYSSSCFNASPLKAMPSDWIFSKLAVNLLHTQTHLCNSWSANCSDGFRLQIQSKSGNKSSLSRLNSVWSSAMSGQDSPRAECKRASPSELMILNSVKCSIQPK